MIAKLIEQLLKELGEDAQREGLERTPARVENDAEVQGLGIISGKGGAAENLPAPARTSRPERSISRNRSRSADCWAGPRPSGAPAG